MVYRNSMRSVLICQLVTVFFLLSGSVSAYASHPNPGLPREREPSVVSIDMANAAIQYDWLGSGQTRVLHGVALAGNDSADFTFDGRTIQFGDGYKIVRTTLHNDSGRLVMLLTASAPSGAFEAAVIQYDRERGEAVSSSFGPMWAMLSESHDVRLASAILAAGGGKTRSASDECTSAASGFMAATLGTVVGCATTGPGGCLIFLLAEGSALDSVLTNCPYEYGDTSGWG